MKKIFITLMLVAYFSPGLFAFNADSAFAKGNNYFQKKEFVKAISEYNSIIKNGYEGASVYFNLGNCYFREGKLGYAILYYEKAAKLNPGDEEITHNLKIANLRTLDKVQVIPSFFVFRIWDKLILSFSVSGWTVVSFILYLVILVSLAIYFVSRITRFQRLSFFMGSITLILLTFSIMFLWQRIGYQHNASKGIVVAATAVAKPAPDQQSKDAFVIHEGIKVQVEDKVSNWIKIKLPDGKTGWITGTNIEII